MLADEGDRLALGSELLAHGTFDLLEARRNPVEGFGDRGGEAARGGSDISVT